MRIGARVWKTAIAVTVAIAVSRLLGLDRPVFAGVAAIICMQPTIAGSVRKGIERMQATIIGAVFSLLALIAIDRLPILHAAGPVMIGLTVLVVMVITVRLGWLDSLVLAAATVVVIMILPPEENIYSYTASRTVVTLVGIIVATIVNAAFVTPRYSGPLWQSVKKLTSATDSIYRLAVEAFCLRKIEIARQAQEMLADSEELLATVSTTREWMEEEARLRERILRPPNSEVAIVGRTVELLASVRQSASTIVGVTMEVLARTPSYAEHSARAYEVLWELAQLSLGIFDRIEARFAGGALQAGEKPAWTEEIHKQLIKAIRDAYTAPRHIFPLVEVSVVAFEIRRVTELLADLDDTLAQLAEVTR